MIRYRLTLRGKAALENPDFIWVINQEGETPEEVFEGQMLLMKALATIEESGRVGEEPLPLNKPTKAEKLLLSVNAIELDN